MRNLQKTTPWWLTAKARNVFFLICLTFLSGGVATTTTGCGAGLAAILCPPCSIVIVAAIGVTLLFNELIDEDDCNCPRPPSEPVIPPDVPPPPQTNWFCVRITSDSECPIDGIFIDDPVDPFDKPVWVFGGPQAFPDPDDNAPPGSMIGLPFERMIWPDRGPAYPEWRDLWQSCQLVHFGDSDGNFDRFMTASGAVNITVHFENGEELDLGPQFVDYGTTFVVRWHSTDGADLVGIEDEPATTQTLTLKTQNGTYILNCHSVGTEIVDMVP